MRMERRGSRVRGLSVLICLLAQVVGSRAEVGDARGLAAQLSKHYRLAKARLTPNGAAGIEAGEVLTVHREGIVGFAESDQAMEDICPTEFLGGELHTEKNTLCTLSAPQSRRAIRVSEPVYVTAISVSSEKHTVSMYLTTGNAGKRAVESHNYYGLVVFRFPKGYLETASAARIEETIDQVLSSAEAAENASAVASPPAVNVDQPANALSARTVPSVSAPRSVPEPADQSVPPLDPLPPPTPEAAPKPAAEANPKQPPEPVEQNVPPLQPLPQPATQEPAAPAERSHSTGTDPRPSSQPPGHKSTPPETAGAQTAPVEGVAIGQTPDQVKAVLGNPEGVVDLGAKSIYVYPHHLKVFFVGGKVSKVQQLENNQ